MKYHVFWIYVVFPPLMFAQNGQTFLDFNTFEEQIQQIYTNRENRLVSENGSPVAELGSEMFMLNNWLVTLTNSAGENPLSQQDSYSKKINSPERGTVLGVRVRFPDWPFPGEAYIRPTFPIMPFTRTGAYANINNGVVTNVGRVKSFSIWVNGRNFPFTMGVRVRNIQNKIIEFPVGSLMYMGWRKLVYHNSSFSESIEDQILPVHPMYPNSIPLLHFDSFVVYRQGNYAGNDFISYIGSSEIEYSPYLLQHDNDIDDESEWGIIKERQENQGRIINMRLYENLLQYEYAKQRMEYTGVKSRYQQNEQNQ